jgi:homoserine acetyltransferase
LLRSGFCPAQRPQTPKQITGKQARNKKDGRAKRRRHDEDNGCRSQACGNDRNVDEEAWSFSASSEKTWEGDFLKKDANNILSMRWNWQHGNIVANPLYDGDFDRALTSIIAEAIVMPGRTDLYFPPEDSAYEVSRMPNAQLRPIESVCEHFAGGPAANPVDVKYIDDGVREILAT